jgi:hypothetical protein
MAVGGRHIRHDWKTFVDWHQVSVRTQCGATTKRHLAGIPGITPQPVIVYAGDKKVSGWCIRCAYSVHNEAKSILDYTHSPVTEYLVPLYQAVIDETAVAYEAHRDRLAYRNGQYK